MKNYRPISILNNFAKVLETVIYSRIYPLVSNYISNDQHGFVEKRSTVSNLASFTQYAFKTLDVCGQVDTIYTDISKAFDHINHLLLLKKLETFGFSDTLILLFSSYLTNRIQYVYYNGHKSQPFRAVSGVPQGSNLGPLMFLLFINDLVQQIECNKCIFADDLKIFTAIRSETDCINLQTELTTIERWCSANNLQLNVTKCKIVTYTRKVNPLTFNYSINGTAVARVSTIKDLGVHFDRALTFSVHRDNIISSATKMLGFLIRNSRSFQIGTMKLLYFTYVRSKLEYASVIWNPYYTIHKISLENVQRRFLKYLFFKVEGTYPCRGYDHQLLLQKFNILSLEIRRQQQLLKFVYNLVHSKIDSPQLLAQLQFFVPRSAARHVPTFYTPYARLNSSLNSPIISMCRAFNTVSPDCDINFTPLSQILSLVPIYFG